MQKIFWIKLEKLFDLSLFIETKSLIKAQDNGNASCSDDTWNSRLQNDTKEENGNVTLYLLVALAFSIVYLVFHILIF